MSDNTYSLQSCCKAMFLHVNKTGVFEYTVWKPSLLVFSKNLPMYKISICFYISVKNQIKVNWLTDKGQRSGVSVLSSQNSNERQGHNGQKPDRRPHRNYNNLLQC